MATKLECNDPRHGTLNGYTNHGCRCSECRAANAAAMRAYNERRRANGTMPKRIRTAEQKAAHALAQRQYHTPARVRMRRYGLDAETYDAMLADQEGLCAVPGCTKDAVAVDHCHETGQVRGLLCHGCNTGIGHLGDNLAGVLAAADYLRRTA